MLSREISDRAAHPWALYLVMRQQNIGQQWPQVAFSDVAPFLDPDIHTGATQNFPEESPLNTLRYLFNAWISMPSQYFDSPLLSICIATFFLLVKRRAKAYR